MANSKKRCKVCRGYFPPEELRKVGLSSVCSSEDCAKGLFAKKHPATKALPEQEGNVYPDVWIRDGGRCQFCGIRVTHKKGVMNAGHVHHITYRSQLHEDDPFRNHEANLVLLCDPHHQVLHSSKKRWQPVVRAWAWLRYVEGTKFLIPEVEGLLLDQGWELNTWGWTPPTERKS